jgi:hypothetical protein
MRARIGIYLHRAGTLHPVGSVDPDRRYAPAGRPRVRCS